MMGTTKCPHCGRLIDMFSEKDKEKAIRHLQGHVNTMMKAQEFLEMLQDCDVNDSRPNLTTTERQRLIEIMEEFDA